MNKKYSDFSLKLKESILNNTSGVVNKELENLSQEIEKDMDKFDNLTKLYNLIMQLPIYNELKEENNRLRLENNHLKNKFGIKRICMKTKFGIKQDTLQQDAISAVYLSSDVGTC